MALKRRKFTKAKQKHDQQISRYQYKTKALFCKMCGLIVENCGIEASAITCADCVQAMILPPEGYHKQKPEEKRPRGWQFMSKYVSPSGKIYEKGRLIDEPK